MKPSALSKYDKVGHPIFLRSLTSQATANWAKTKKEKSKLKKLRKGLIKGDLTEDRRKNLWTSILTADMAAIKKKVSYEVLFLLLIVRGFLISYLQEQLSKPVDLKWIVQIDKDIERCLRIHQTYSVRYGEGFLLIHFFLAHSNQRQCRLFRLLRSYTAFDDETRYTQGMSTLAAILLLQIEVFREINLSSGSISSFSQDEETAFYAFVNLFENWNLHDWYKNDLEGLRTDVFITFDVLLEKFLKKIKRHLVPLSYSSTFLSPPPHFSPPH